MEHAFCIETISGHVDKDVLRQLATIHKEEIGGGFLAKLGTPFLVRLYRALSGSPYSFVIVARQEDDVAGFICGATDTRSVYRHFMLRWGIFTLPVLLPRLVSPSRLRRVFETLLYPSKKENQDLPRPEILNFCVSQRWQRKGLGKKLFGALVEEFRRRDVPRIKIVTGDEQTKAQMFYESLNATKAAEIEIHDGTKSLVYTYDIPDSK